MSAPRLNTTRGLLEACGGKLTYRMLDYWIAQGYVNSVDVNGAGNGTGNYRIYDDLATERIVMMSALVAAGMKPAGAARAVDEIEAIGFARLGPLLIVQGDRS